MHARAPAASSRRPAQEAVCSAQVEMSARAVGGHTRLVQCSKEVVRGRAAAPARAPARAAARERRAGERCCIFWAFDVLSSDPADLDSRTPGTGRKNARLGLVNRRSPQSRLTGRSWRWIVQEDDVEGLMFMHSIHWRSAVSTTNAISTIGTAVLHGVLDMFLVQVPVDIVTSFSPYLYVLTL